MSNLMFGCPTCDIIVKQYAFFACSRISSSILGVLGMSAALCGLSECMFAASPGTIASLIASTKCMSMSALFRVSIAKSERSSLSRVVSIPLVCSLERASAAWCFIPARWITSMLNWDRQNRHRTSWPGLSDRFKMHLSK